MLKSPSRKTTAHVAMGLAACWFVGPKELAAQPTSTAPHVLVVVANSSDAKCVKRLGGDHVQVEPLFTSETGALPNSYDACNKRARNLLDFRLLIFRGGMFCAAEGFWRERMTGANPQGKVHRLSQSRLSADNDWEHLIRLAIDIHGALVSILPDRKTSLDANLKSELHRLRSRQFHPSQFTLRE